MPRRNQRDSAPEPGIVRLAPLPKPPSLDDVRRTRDRDMRLQREREQAEHEAAQRAAIDWRRCLVPLCDDRPISGLREDHTVRLPLCIYHETMVWRTVQQHNGRPDIIKASERLAEEDRQRDQAERARHLANRNGSIYYVRLNGLIKVGWSRTVHARLRAYGPDVEVLCIHKGSRDDETNLHRNLRPYLARGREWYEDCPAMRDIIATAVERHGTPTVYDLWTRPAQPQVKPRTRR